MTTSVPTRPTRREFEAQQQGLVPLELFDPVVTTINATTGIRPLAYLDDGKLYGAHPDDDEIHVSTDDGDSWTKYCDVVAGTGRIRQIYDLSDGEVLVQKAKNLVKSTNWSSGTPTWAVKLTSSTVDGGATFSFNDYTCDVAGSVVAACEYGNPWETQTSSIKVWISTDNADTFTVFAQTGTSPFLTTQTHFHGLCLTRDGSRVYFSPGHGEERGVWSSPTNTISWNQHDNSEHELGRVGNAYSSWIGMASSNDAIVLTSDDNPSAIGYLDLTVPLADQKIEVIHVEHNQGLGLIFFGNRVVWDETRDIFYAGPNNRNEGSLRLPLYGIKGRQVHRIWMWDRASAQSQLFRTICVEPNTGDLVCAIEDENGGFHQLKASYAGAGSPGLQAYRRVTAMLGEFSDAALIAGGAYAIGPGSYVGKGNSFASGPGAYCGGLNSQVDGVRATDNDYDNVFVQCFRAAANGIRAWVSGIQSSGGAKSTIVGHFIDAAARAACAIVGDGTTVDGNNGAGVGQGMTVGLRGANLGQGTRTGTDGTAAGRGAQAEQGNDVALGQGTVTTRPDQVMAGARDVEISASDHGLILTSPDSTSWRVTVDNTGTLQIASVV